MSQLSITAKVVWLPGLTSTMRPNSLVMSVPEKAGSLISKPLFKDALCALPSPYKVIVQALKCQCYCNNTVTHKSDGARWVTLEVSLEKLTGSFVKRQHAHRELDVWTWKLSEHRRVRLALRNPSQLLSDTLKKKTHKTEIRLIWTSIMDWWLETFCTQRHTDLKAPVLVF